MRALLGLLTVAILLSLAPAAMAADKRLTVHTKRLSDKQVQLHGRAPASASISVTLKSLQGKFLARIGYGTNGRRYGGFFSAPRSAFRIIVTAQTSSGELRRTRRVAAALD